jgi:hypothetical protein
MKDLNFAPSPWRIGPINYADVYGSDGELVGAYYEGT